MNTSRHPDTASHVFSSLTVSFHICLSFLEYPAHNMGISFMLRARTLAFVPRVAVRGRSARRAREMWLAQINLRATPGTRRKLQPPACCNKLAFSSNINSGPWTHTSPDDRLQHCAVERMRGTLIFCQITNVFRTKDSLRRRSPSPGFRGV